MEYHQNNSFFTECTFILNYSLVLQPNYSLVGYKHRGASARDWVWRANGWVIYFTLKEKRFFFLRLMIAVSVFFTSWDYSKVGSDQGCGTKRAHTFERTCKRSLLIYRAKTCKKKKPKDKYEKLAASIEEHNPQGCRWQDGPWEFLFLLSFWIWKGQRC